MDKVKFWKNNDDFDLDSDLPPIGGGMPNDELGIKESDPAGFKPKPLKLDDFAEEQPDPRSMGGPSFSQQAPVSDNTSRMLDLISSKLDTIKAELDSLNQRVMSLEKKPDVDEKDKRKFFNKDPWSSYR